MHISGLPMSSLSRWLYLRFVHSNSLTTRAPPTWACSNQHNGTSSLKFKSRERTDNPNRIDEAHDDGRMRVYVSCRQKKPTVLDSGSDRVEVQHPRASIRSDLRRPPSDLSLHPPSSLLARLKPTPAPCRSLASLVAWLLGPSGGGRGVTSLNECNSNVEYADRTP